MQFSAQTKSWLLLICTATASGIAAASIASKGGCDTTWTIIAGVGGAVTAVSHALMTSPQNAQVVQDASIQAKYDAERAKIGNP